MKQWWQLNRWWVMGLMIFYAATTIPFASRTPYNWDAAQFVLGIEHFSVHMHQPHPPGYPLFIALGKIVSLVFAPNTALVMISAGFGAISVVLLYLLILDLWPERRALAAVITASWIINPLFWLYRELALTYTVDAAAVLAMAWLAWRTRRYRHHRYLLAGVMVVTIAAGFRPSLLVLLSPFFIYQVWFHKRNWRWLVQTASIGLICFLAWFIPLVMMAGGWQQYHLDSTKLYSTVSEQTSILARAPFTNIRLQVELLLTTVLEAWNVMLLPIVMSVIGTMRFIWRRGFKAAWRIARPYLLWLSVWVLPAFFVYGLVHLGQLGYMLYFLPLGYIACAPAWLWLSQRVRLTPLLFGLVFIAHAMVFLWLRPTYAHPEFIPRNDAEEVRQRFARQWPNAFKMNRHVIAEQDQKHLAYRAVLKNYDPARTIIMSGRNVTYTSPLNGLTIRNDELFRELSVMVPQYRMLELGPGRDYFLDATNFTLATTYEQTITVPTTTRYVIFALHVLPSEHQPAGLILERQRLEGTPYYYYLGIMDKPWQWLGYTIQYDSIRTSP